jgi:hypothetical protein
MANIVQLEWTERNKEYIYRLSNLQALYGHSKSPFQILGAQVVGPKQSSTSLPGGVPNPIAGASGAQTGSGEIKSINDVKGLTVAVEIPLQEDFQLNLESSFQSIEDMLPGGQEFLNIVKKVGSATGKTNDFMSIFGFQVWEKTNPIEISLELHFHTIRSGWLDVWAPIMSLCSQAILSADVEADESKGIFKSASTYSTPGISLSNSKVFTSAAKRQKQINEDIKDPEQKVKESKDLAGSNAKVVKVTIPGILLIETGIIKSAKPTFSKEITESGAPLWGKLDLNIQSVLPAFDGMIYQQGLKFISKLKKKNLKDKLAGFVKNAF